MIGLIEHVSSPAAKQLQDEIDALLALRSAGNRIRRVWKTEYKGRHGWSRAQRIRALRRCEELSRRFREVQRDETVTRRMQAKGSRESVDIPLIFHTSLPLKRETTITVYRGRDTYSATARSPMPTVEALDAMREHKHLFDYLEIWWVPNDVLVEKLPDPDPILVGAVQVENQRFYYELSRWVDEDAELGWWSKEAY